MKTKIFLLLFVICGVLTSCGHEPNGVYELTYVVFYPNNADTVTVQVKSDNPFNAGCSRGENYIWGYRAGTVITTSAPLKIINQVKIK